MELIWTRESVCMGDDCTAPNLKEETVAAPPTILGLLTLAADYVPRMRNCVWVVWAEHELVGYLLIEEDPDSYQIEPVRDGEVPAVTSLHIHCDYYCNADFYGEFFKDRVERYPECATLLEKVKRAVRERGQRNG